MVIVFDLDDTLYDEMTFVKSGFYAVACALDSENAPLLYTRMMALFLDQGSGRVFDILCDEMNLTCDVMELVDIYRFHTPYIHLPLESTMVLAYAKQRHQTALITDGIARTQRNKFDALGLHQSIEYPVFTDEHRTKKPEHASYEMVMKRFPLERYVYIADNPNKDFEAPKALGWHTIRYANPVGIYRNVPNVAEVEITTLSACIKVIESYE
jgi:putative hydrolase of the HAD superfamily